MPAAIQAAQGSGGRRSQPAAAHRASPMIGAQASSRIGGPRRLASAVPPGDTASHNFSKLMKFEVERTRALMLEGAPLGRFLPGRIGLEIRAIVAGGLRILDKIEAVGYDVFARRPTLGALDWPLVMLRAL